MSNKRLVRPSDDKLLMGVAGGIAQYLNIDPLIVRALWIVAGLLSAGHAILAYVLLAILMPKEQAASGKVHAFDPDEEIIIKDSL